MNWSGYIINPYIAASKREQEPETIITSGPLLLLLHRRKSCVPCTFCSVFACVECEWPIQNQTNWKMVHKRKKKASSDSRVSALGIKMGWCEQQMSPRKSKTLWDRNKKETMMTAKRDKKKVSSSVFSETRRGLSLWNF